ncbi:HoxV (plasmid) [Cupriavidus necator]|uniref:nickel-dependent hydrogenase large subunit n=1 Tax=Cupriavidus necator TaxID=106590 RepID=UPI003F73938E
MTTIPGAGKLVFLPGAEDPIRSHRVPLAGLLLSHTPAEMAPERLAGLYGLCGQAHRLTARLAIDAARGLRNQPTAGELAGLAAETLREHVRRVWLDWPRLQGADVPPATGARALAACPALRGHGAPLDATMRFWIENALLGEDAITWLTYWRADPIACLDQWAAKGNTMPARILRNIAAEARALEAGAVPLQAHAEIRTLSALACEIAGDPAFEQKPTWKGRPCETGSWTRLADAEHGHADRARSAWFRFGARIAEMTALAVETTSRLGAGVVTLAPREALAWSEMARGLLLHRVRLERGGPEPMIAEYQVVAPTEWNFHPRSAVALLLGRTPAALVPEQRCALERRIGVLSAAFDPCVDFQIEYSHA